MQQVGPVLRFGRCSTEACPGNNPHKPVALPAKTCSCKEHMPQKHGQIKKLPCFNDWSLILINIHPKAKEDNKTASSNPDPVSSDDTATSTEVTAQNIKNGGSVIVKKGLTSLISINWNCKNTDFWWETVWKNLLCGL